MPQSRQPLEIWRITRLKVWTRDEGRCQSPLEPPLCTGKPSITLEKCHIDHIHSGKRGDNQMSNMRVLCPICHSLRKDRRHDGLRAKMLHKDLLPVNWRELLWE